MSIFFFFYSFQFFQSNINQFFFFLHTLNLKLFYENFILFLIYSEKKIIDIDKPLRPGAFVDTTKLKQFTEEDYILPETPPFSWLIRKTKVN